MLDAFYLLVWRCSHILTDSTPADSVGWCRLNQSSVRLSYWSGDDGNYVTFIVGWCWTHMLVNTKLKHRLSPSSSNIVTTAYSTHPGAPLIEATKGSQCQLIFNSPSSICWNSNTTPRPSGHISVFGFFVVRSFLGTARQWSREKFAILSLKPRSQVSFSLYRKWAVKPEVWVFKKRYDRSRAASHWITILGVIWLLGSANFPPLEIIRTAYSEMKLYLIDRISSL